MAGLWTVAIPYVPKLTMCLLTIRVIDNFCQLIIMKNLSLIYVLFHNSVLSPSFLPSITLHPSFCTEDWIWATKHVGKVLCHCAAFPAHNSVLCVVYYGLFGRIVPLWYIGGKIIRCYSTLGILRTFLTRCWPLSFHHNLSYLREKTVFFFFFCLCAHISVWIPWVSDLHHLWQ